MNLTNLHLNNDWIEFLQDELESDSFKLILKNPGNISLKIGDSIYKIFL
mgnify:CR=1 FL=1